MTWTATVDSITESVDPAEGSGIFVSFSDGVRTYQKFFRVGYDAGSTVIEAVIDAELAILEDRDATQTLKTSLVGQRYQKKRVNPAPDVGTPVDSSPTIPPITPTTPPVVIPGVGRLIMGLPGVSDVADATNEFIRWDKYTRGISEFAVNGINYDMSAALGFGWVDADWELINPLPANAQSIGFGVAAGSLQLDGSADHTGLQMKVKWDDGAAVTNVFPEGGISNVVTNLASKSATFTMTGPEVLNASIGLSLSGTEPPTNIRIFKAAQEANLDAGEVFDPEWIAEVGQWPIIRTMDWSAVNLSSPTEFNGLANDSFKSWRQSDGDKVGVPPSVMAKLANESGRAVWVNIPHSFSDAAVQEYAEVFENTVDSSIPIIYEFSNEIWNSGTVPNLYAIAQSVLPGVPAAISGAHLAWAAWRGTQMFEIIRSVYGEDSGNRWRGVLCSQSANDATLTEALTGVDLELQSSGLTINQLYTYAGIAPYWGGFADSTFTEPGATINGWIDTSLAIDGTYAFFNQKMYEAIHPTSGLAADQTLRQIGQNKLDWAKTIAIANARGLEMVWYEGGNTCACSNPLRDNISPETQGDKINLALANFANSAEAALLHRECMDEFLADGGFMPAKFVDRTPHTKYGPWGAQRYFADTSNPVYVAMENWNAGN